MKINKKGFTLAELLVVVAIIGILVAVSIPIFAGQLEKARVATNQANIRAAKAAASADYMTNQKAGSYCYYDYVNSTGKLDSGWLGSYPIAPAVAISNDNKISADKLLDSMISFAEECKGTGVYSDVFVRVSGEGITTCPYYDESSGSIKSDAFG